MKRFALALAALTVSTPVVAQDFTGPRVGVEVGLVDDDFLGSEEVSWGIVAGYDIDLGQAVVGGTIGYSDLFDDDFGYRELSIGGRAGMKLNPTTLIYGSVAYSDIDISNLSVDGVKFGLGGEFAVTPNVFVNVETRYGTYDFDTDLYQTVIGVGYRF